jgi:hypothetical protein
MAIHKIDGVDGVVSYPKKFVTLYAQGAITKGDVVGIGTVVTKGAGLHVVVTDATTPLTDGSIRVVGVAAETAADGEEVKIQVAGYNSDATSGAAAIAIHLEVQFDIASVAEKAGCLMAAAAPDATHKPFGIVVTAYSAADVSDGAIFIYDHGYYG